MHVLVFFHESLKSNNRHFESWYANYICEIAGFDITGFSNYEAANMSVERGTPRLNISVFPSDYARPYYENPTVINNPNRRPCEMFRKVFCFYGKDSLAPDPPPKLEDHPLSALR